uniref:Endonuclease/exonuclease/phosphatase domain-containing protein n=1 Tax=Pygocentrus nattereri TaxID=42514 RepID=A0A3B4DAS6_PYGNA
MVLSLKIISWNIRGIVSPAKRTKVLNHLNTLKSDICFIQETHLTEAASRNLTINNGLARLITLAYCFKLSILLSLHKI